MIIVTGAAGFIGSHLVKGLNAMGCADILAVDDLTDGRKFKNLAALSLIDYQDYEDFLQQVLSGSSSIHRKKIDAIFHEGACSVTTEWNGRYMMRNNYEYSKQLLHFSAQHKIPFIYASSAAVYGGSQTFTETSHAEMPLNVYGYSKWLFDQYMLQQRITSQVVGLRYFNVYGPHEQHKGPMASVAFHFMNQLKETGVVKLFAGYDGYADGEQLRDFIYVEDIVKVNLWFLKHREQSGIFNVGTGKARTFNDIARILIALHGAGTIQYIPFPETLKSAYQSFTEAEITKLRNAGYHEDFYSLEEGLRRYFNLIHPSPSSYVKQATSSAVDL